MRSSARVRAAKNLSAAFPLHDVRSQACIPQMLWGSGRLTPQGFQKWFLSLVSRLLVRFDFARVLAVGKVGG
jgi:hypothetical protein